jgi:uncharacterized paraquat-inducible protein A
MSDVIGFLVVAVVALIVFAFVVARRARKRALWAMMTPEEQEQQLAAQEAAVLVQAAEEMDRLQGIPNPAMICPHCQTKGSVRVKEVKHKSGISGAKATGAVLTGGVSVLATGLSRKEQLTQAHCETCGATWHF